MKAVRAPSDRLVGLDVARGLFLVVSVVSTSVLPPRPAALEHASWSGVTAIDVVFPLFVTLSGCGLALAHGRTPRWTRTVRRAVVLLLLGLLYGAAVAGSTDLATLRLTGPLQVYAVLVLIIAVAHRVVSTPRGWVAVTLAVAGVQSAVLLVARSRCPGSELSPDCNPSRSIDTAVLGASHLYHGGGLGHDPEGLVAVLGALLTASVGVTAGHLVIAARRESGARVGTARLAAWAGVVALLAVATASVLPVMKRLWTTPFALGVAAGGVLLLLAALVVMDSPAARWWAAVRDRWAWPLVALGRNSLLVYFGSHLVMHVMLVTGSPTPWAVRVAGTLDVLGHPRPAFAGAMLASWVALAGLLHRRRLYVRP